MTEDDEAFDRDALLSIFFATVEESLVDVEASLVGLQSSPDDGELLKTALRGLHTLKGNSAAVALDQIGQLCHVLEEPLMRVRSGALHLTEPVITFLLGGVDALREMIRVERDGVRAMCSSSPGEGDVKGSRDRGFAGVRVAPRRIDRMLSIVTELAIARAQINELVRRAAPGAVDEGLARYRDTERLHVELEDIVMKLGMVPLEPVLRQYARAVRDAAAQCEKAAILVVDAQGVELDGAIVDQLRDPLLHMVRNAVDHGLETPGAREAVGKDPVGRVTLRAFHDAGSVVVEVEDDGAGLDRARILAHARARGMTVLDDLSAAETYRLVLEPGFSTADTVTDLSGRGVGMDVVARNVSALRGRIEVQNGPGGGAMFSIRLPLTLAIIDGFTVDAGLETFIIPSSAVDEFVDARALRGARAGGMLRWRGRPIPLVHLARLFALDGGDGTQVVVVHHAGGRAALAVDAIHGSSRTVIKPLRGLARASDGIAGSSIVGGGRVAYVLDVPSILKRAGARSEAGAA